VVLLTTTSTGRESFIRSLWAFFYFGPESPSRCGQMKRFLTLLLILGIGCCAAFAQAERAPDPSGANTGGASDIAVKDANQPTPGEILAAVGHNKVAINMMWTLITGFLVMFMQAGFAMVETGLTQAKNVAHTFAMNFLVYPLGMLGFYVLGFGIMFGGLGA